ncbi:hypothetical protein [Acidipropionibacterium virtanenii]|uniref:Uncharacterized protein n=1 Tax=Acidipropionibacterium virtanenii TaxID=2057246 RepID=A0A344UX67_9ACTN|nr:hypothetical protein [Acidipropionibacterium virtanenii]AXE39865.1 hypothetical protein JS278_02730 [Acidipropionibacterium virtanenii]
MAKHTPDSGDTPRRADTSSLDDLLDSEEEAEKASGASARRAGGKGGHRRGPKIFLAVALAFILIVVAALGFYLKSVSSAISNIDRDPGLIPDTSATPVPPGSRSTSC